MRCCQNVWRNLVAYRLALKAWRVAGKPRRRPLEIEALFEVCKACDAFVARPGRPWRGSCADCGCYIGRHPHRFLRANKIALATEHCPRGKW
jgi:hypothetical protein